VPAVLDIRNHKAAIDYIREEAKSAGRKQSAVSMTVIKRIHDLLLGNTPEAQANRAAAERRERTEKELTKERDRAGLRRDMPLHRTYFHDIAPPAKVPDQLQKLIDFCNTSEFKEYHPVKQSAVLHYGVMQVFPFTDNSGKVARLLMNLILMRARYLPAIIHAIDRQRYYETLRQPNLALRALVIEAEENSLDNAFKFFEDHKSLDVSSRRARASA